MVELRANTLEGQAMAARILVAFILLLGGDWLAVDLLAEPKPTDPPKVTTSDPVTEREHKYMAALHRNTVEVFVDRPGMGIRRLSPTYADVINAPKPLQSNGQGSIVEPEKPKIEAKKPDKDKDSHFTFQDTIKGRFGGYPASETEQWNVRKVQLVGLTKNPKPVVYDTANVPGMKGVKDIPTRELNAFEKQALEALQSGDNLKVDRRGAEMRVMGPIYAGKQCLTCHDKPGEMLGAFTYVLERQQVKKTK
jgi:Protein of unknown function (DUF3365)